MAFLSQLIGHCKAHIFIECFLTVYRVLFEEASRLRCGREQCQGHGPVLPGMSEAQ